MSEIKISPQLSQQLENSQIRNSVEDLIDFKNMVDNFFAENNLTDEMKERVSKKMEKLTNAYLKIKNINEKSKRSNIEKVEKIKRILLELGAEDFNDVIEEMDKITRELLSKIDEEIDEIVQLVNNRHENLKAQKIFTKVNEELDKLKEVADSAKSTVTSKKEQSTALVKKEPKKSWFEKITDVLMEKSENWVRQDSEKDGKHIVTYKDEDGNLRSEYEATENIEENEKRDEKARKFGLFSRLKVIFGKEERTKEQNAIREKIKAIDEEIKKIGEMTFEGACAYADKKIEEFVEKVKGKINFKQLLEELAKNYDWAETKREILERKSHEITQELSKMVKAENARKAKERTLNVSVKEDMQQLMKINEEIQILENDIKELNRSGKIARAEVVKKQLEEKKKERARLLKEYQQDKGLKDLVTEPSETDKKKIERLIKSLFL